VSKESSREKKYVLNIVGTISLTSNDSSSHSSLNVMSRLFTADQISSSKMKLDQGVKSLFRPFRNVIGKMFDACLTQFGQLYKDKKHYWTDDEMAYYVASFMVSKLGIPAPTPHQVGCVTMLVYSSKGKTENKAGLRTYPALKAIGPDFMDIFKNIFDKPTKDLFELFFEDELVRYLWVMIIPFMDYDTCFPKGKVNESILKTYHELTRLVTKKSLPMP
jgi:hypothetical protein